MAEQPRRAPRHAEAERNDRALLAAAREVLATDGAHASVAAIARRAGVGIGSLYRRYRTKEELFQRLCEIALDDYRTAAEEGLALDDPWDGLAHYVSAAIAIGPGSLAPIAGSVVVTAEMAAKNRDSDEAVATLIDRAHAAGVLRAGVSAVDLALLIEQLAKSPLHDQLATQGRTDLIAAADNARARITAIALDGLRATGHPLPGHAPEERLLSERWSPPRR